MHGSDEIASRLGAVRDEIAAAEAAFDRPSGAVTLVAVSKTKPQSDVLAAYAAGQRVFGENRVQEGLQKFDPLRASLPDLVLHLIGPLQTNKVADAVRTFEVIETVDRLKLAESLAQAWRQPGVRLKSCFIQVNTGAEPQKAGILPHEADDFIATCRDRLGLPVVGLMCIPPVEDEPALHFAFLKAMALRHGLRALSMGMSGDYRLAIQQGATHVRIGSAIFGDRVRAEADPAA